MKKRLGIIAGILGIVLAVIGIVLKQKENTAVSVIGGADGPTSIFIAGKLNVDNFIFMYCSWNYFIDFGRSYFLQT